MLMILLEFHPIINIHIRDPAILFQSILKADPKIEVSMRAMRKIGAEKTGG